VDHRRFLKKFIPLQATLRGYLLAATRDIHEADDLLQEISSTLWEKFDKYDEARPFFSWAVGIAHLEVAKWRQRRARSREVISETTLDLLAQTAAQVAPDVEAQSLYVEGCLEWLKGVARQVVEMRYGQQLPILKIAEAVSKNVAAVEMILVRARRVLQECIDRKLNGLNVEGV